MTTATSQRTRAPSRYTPPLGTRHARVSHTNGGLYAYAANSPVCYTDPDGRAVVIYLKYGLLGGNESDEYVVRPQTYLEKTVFEKVQAHLYPIKGAEIVSLSYSLLGEHKIEEEKNDTSFADIALTGVSIAGDFKLAKGGEKAGRIAGWIGNIKFGVGLVKSYEDDILNCAIEEITCNLFMFEMASDSPESSEKLYSFAKERMNLLYYSGNLNIDYNLAGRINSYTAKDPLDIEVIRNDLNNYKRELKYGIQNE